MKRTFNSEKASKATKKAAQMPQRRHHQNNSQFDIMRSEVVDWLCQQPEIRQSIFNHFNDLGAIVFDPESKTWTGREVLDSKISETQVIR